MALNPPSNSKNEGSRSDPTPGSAPDASAEEYKVGPGRPPREFQYKPGQSGNPKGARRKPPSIAPDLKLLLERALSTKVKLKQGEKEQIVTKAAAGIEQLVNQFAKGDRHARRDLIALADKLGLNLAAGQAKALEAALTVNDEALLADYLQSHGGGRDHRSDEVGDGPGSRDSEKPDETNPGEKKTSLCATQLPFQRFHNSENEEEKP
jgi:hypothetical protein